MYPYLAMRGFGLRSHASLTADCRMIPQNGAAFYTRKEYAKDRTQTLVVSERPLSD